MLGRLLTYIKLEIGGILLPFYLLTQLIQLHSHNSSSSGVKYLEAQNECIKDEEEDTRTCCMRGYELEHVAWKAVVVVKWSNGITKRSCSVCSGTGSNPTWAFSQESWKVFG